jgi:hypothetical protein
MPVASGDEVLRYAQDDKEKQSALYIGYLYVVDVWISNEEEAHPAIHP